MKCLKTGIRQEVSRLTSGCLGLLTLKDKLNYFSVAFTHKSIQAFYLASKYISNVLPFTELRLLPQLTPQVNVAEAADPKTPRKRMDGLVNVDLDNLGSRSAPPG